MAGTHMTTANTQVDVDPATWLEVVSLVAGVLDPMIPIAVFAMASNAAKHLDADISSNPPKVITPRVQRLKPFKSGDPPCGSRWSIST